MMLKYFAVGVFLWHQVVNDVYGQTGQGQVDTEVPNLFVIVKPTNNRSTEISLSDPESKISFHASQQFFYLQGLFPSGISTSSSSRMQQVGGQRRDDYLVTDGIGAHKLHTRRLAWSRARQACTEEGGHLAIIRTSSEEKIMQQMMVDESIQEAWVGYHDMFEEGHWITVLDEPFAQTGWTKWSKKFNPNPDNWENRQHCGRLIADGGGLDDDVCTYEKPFICKI